MNLPKVLSQASACFRLLLHAVFALAFTFTASASMVQITCTNSVTGLPDTNVFKIWAVSQIVNSDGSFNTIGVPQRIMPAANGSFTNYLRQNNYVVTNDAAKFSLAFSVPDNTSNQITASDWMISGGNYFVTRLINTNSVGGSPLAAGTNTTVRTVSGTNYVDAIGTNLLAAQIATVNAAVTNGQSAVTLGTITGNGFAVTGGNGAPTNTIKPLGNGFDFGGGDIEAVGAITASGTVMAPRFSGRFSGSGSNLTDVPLNPLIGQFYLSAYGAKADRLTLRDVSITNGSAQIYSPSANWTAADVGKTIVLYTSFAVSASPLFVSGGSSFYQNQNLSTNTTIVSVQGTTHCTLAATMPTNMVTEIEYGTDAGTALQAATTAAANLGYGEVLADGAYIVGTPLQDPTMRNGVIVIPNDTTSSTKTIRIRGVSQSINGISGFYTYNYPTNGTSILFVTPASGTNPACFSGSRGLVPGTSRTPHNLDFQNIEIRTMPNSGMGVLNMMNGGGYDIRDSALTVDCHGPWSPNGNNLVPMNTNSVAVYGPVSPSNGRNTIKDTLVVGYGIGLVTSDHQYVDRVRFALNELGIYMPYGGDLVADHGHWVGNHYGFRANGGAGYAYASGIDFEANGFDFDSNFYGTFIGHALISGSAITFSTNYVPANVGTVKDVRSGLVYDSQTTIYTNKIAPNVIRKGADDSLQASSLGSWQAWDSTASAAVLSIYGSPINSFSGITLGNGLFSGQKLQKWWLGWGSYSGVNLDANQFSIYNGNSGAGVNTQPFVIDPQAGTGALWVLSNGVSMTGTLTITNLAVNQPVGTNLIAGVAMTNGSLSTTSANVSGTVTASNVWDKSNVKWWGAVGDGSHDDTAAIQAALDNVAQQATNAWIYSMRGDKVFIPEGNYKVTSTLTIRRGTHIIGGGKESTMITSFATNGDILYYSRPNTNMSTEPLIGIKDLSVAVAFGVTNLDGACIHLDSDDPDNATGRGIQVELENVTCWYGYIGFKLRNILGGTITACRAHASGSDGFSLSGFQTLLSVSSSYASSCLSNGWAITGPSYSSWKSCGADNCVLAGWKVYAVVGGASMIGNFFQVGSELNGVLFHFESMMNTTADITGLANKTVAPYTSNGLELNSCSSFICTPYIGGGVNCTGYAILVQADCSNIIFNGGDWSAFAGGGLLTSGRKDIVTLIASQGANGLTEVAKDLTVYGSASIATNLNVRGFAGFGINTPLYPMHSLSANQFANGANLTDSGANGGLFLDDSINTVNSGGTLTFGVQGLKFVAIKSLLQNGGGNGAGDLAFSVRKTIADTNLTEAVRINQNGYLGIATNNPRAALHVVGNEIVSGSVTAGSLLGTLDATNLTSGIIPQGRLAIGQTNSTTGLSAYWTDGTNRWTSRDGSGLTNLSAGITTVQAVAAVTNTPTLVVSNVVASGSVSAGTISGSSVSASVDLIAGSSVKITGNSRIYSPVNGLLRFLTYDGLGYGTLQASNYVASGSITTTNGYVAPASPVAPALAAWGGMLWSDGTNMCVVLQNANGTKSTNKLTMTSWP